MTIIDITPLVSAATPMFPGDTKFSATRCWEIGADCPVNVSRIVMSTHTGAHADAPLHYDENGKPIDQVDLAPYIGPCAVVQLTDQSPLVSKDSIAKALDEISVTAPERVIIRTYERIPSEWDENFTAIDAGAIDWLATCGCRLIGVDTPSLDPASSKTMDAHNAVRRADMRILEGLRLDDVAPGVYELIAPPLKLKGLDAAPVRALLRTMS
ncbi:arylformamidase [Hyphococcus flavus]|uniref:Kynurenine formamidase n=1 Tax=Hyphococcus flavus TaxID=1866326 RepID=A0AAE9ZA26_9PROT|nr:arylformamidase [Hyphococcus flavus]WDI30323.1 arylformamidase [Hyphococcus flavus]